MGSTRAPQSRNWTLKEGLAALVLLVVAANWLFSNLRRGMADSTNLLVIDTVSKGLLSVGPLLALSALILLPEGLIRNLAMYALIIVCIFQYFL